MFQSKITEKTKDIHWYPMRVTYGRQMILKEHLEKDKIEYFLPMRYDIVDHNGERSRELVPAVTNLIFIHSSQDELTHMKMYKRYYEPLRDIARESVFESKTEIITLPDSSLENFMKVAKEPNDNVEYLETGDYVTNALGKKVTVIKGPFAGVKGVIKRIKRNKRVVVQLEGIIAAAISFVPSDNLLFEN